MSPASEASDRATARRVRIVVPVKPLAVAKQRLAAVLSPAERGGLVEAMLRDVLNALVDGGRIADTVVATNDELAAGIATAAGAEVRADRARSYNDLLATLARELEHEGAGAVAIVPADLPLLGPADLVGLGVLERGESGKPVAVVAPDRHGDGTNLLGLGTPTLIVPAFGPGSFARHRDAAERSGARVVQVSSPALGLDVDTPDDLAELSRRCDAASARIALATRAFLERIAAPRSL